jgi:mannose-1-phosphate guanylyltransferase
LGGNNGLWAIILAAGEGSRVKALTTDAVGGAVPKQFCSFGGEKTMLRWTLDRARSIVPPGHVVAVVAEQHRRFWTGPLARMPPENVVVQPQNRGTAAGVLLPLLHVLRCDAQARIVVLPSDHYVADERVLRRTVRKAVRSLGVVEGRIVLLGMRPSACDLEYGWIVPSAISSGILSDVSRFVEKPSVEAARALMERGALVNAFTMLGDASTLLRLYERTLPELLGMFLQREGAASGGLETLYAGIPSADFSRDVLERSIDGLSVLPVPECGWSDLGTPARIQMFLAERARSAIAYAPSHGSASLPGGPGSTSRPARVATLLTSSAGATGLATCMPNPEARALAQSSWRT